MKHGIDCLGEMTVHSSANSKPNWTPVAYFSVIHWNFIVAQSASQRNKRTDKKKPFVFPPTSFQFWHFRQHREACRRIPPLIYSCFRTSFGTLRLSGTTAVEISANNIHIWHNMTVTFALWHSSTRKYPTLDRFPQTPSMSKSEQTFPHWAHQCPQHRYHVQTREDEIFKLAVTQQMGQLI